MALRIIKTIPSLLPLFIYIWLNSALYYRPDFSTANNISYNQSVLDQLHFLKRILHSDGAGEMQDQYPEGYYFMYYNYGLAWCNFAKHLPHQSALYKEAITEIDYALMQINSPGAPPIFDEHLPIPYGAFSAGWNNYLLGTKLNLQIESEWDSSEINRFESQCQKIEKGLFANGTPFPESYPGRAWPADASVCVASLSLHDRILRSSYQKTISTWINKTKAGLDDRGMVPFEYDPINLTIKQEARGSSQGLTLVFLKEIDSAFGRQQFLLYRENFLDSHWGLPGIREFPSGEESFEDVDSGPVIFGIGGAASLTGQHTMLLYGDEKTALGIRNSIEAFGLSYSLSGEKKILFGKWPIADAFTALAASQENTETNELNSDANWRWKFQLYSGICLILLLSPLYFIWRRK